MMTADKLRQRVAEASKAPRKRSRDEAHEYWKKAYDTSDRLGAFKAAKWTEPEIRAFYEEVRGFSYPGQFGQSPWEFAFGVAYDICASGRLPRPYTGEDSFLRKRTEERREACRMVCPNLPEHPDVAAAAAPGAATRSTYDMVMLADREYGNHIMKRVAEEHFASDPTCLFVQVYEHGGWCLGYTRDGNVWSSANDRAHLSPGARPTEYSGRCVRRTDADAAKTAAAMKGEGRAL